MIERYTWDDAFLAAAPAAGGVALRVFTPPFAAVVLGAGSRPERELDLDACRADGIPLLRRPGGGCAVVVDPGNVVVSVAYPAPGFGGNRAHFDAISARLGGALAELGFPGVTVEGGSDLALGGRKFAGACVHRARGLLYYSATLLVDPRLELLPRYLAHPPREPAYRAGRAHLDFVRPLAAHVPGWTAGQLAGELSRRLEAAPPVPPAAASPGAAFPESPTADRPGPQTIGWLYNSEVRRPRPGAEGQSGTRNGHGA